MKRFKKGFTLLELLVVIAIIGILTAMVVFAISDARKKGADAGVKSNLAGARSQAEVFFNTNTANPDTYIGVCEVGGAAGAEAIGNAVAAAAKSVGLSGYSINGVPNAASLTVATCNESPTGGAWATEVPLRSAAGEFWCIDSTGLAIKTSSSIGSGFACI